MPVSRPTSSKALLRRVVGFTPCAAAFAGLALLAAACGSSPATPAVANIGSTTATGTISTTTTAGGGAQAGGTRPQSPGGSSSCFRHAITGSKSGSLEAFSCPYALARRAQLPRPKWSGWDLDHLGQRHRSELAPVSICPDGLPEADAEGGGPEPGRASAGAGAEVLRLHAFSRGAELPRHAVPCRWRHLTQGHGGERGQSELAPVPGRAEGVPQ